MKPTATITENNISVFYDGVLYPPISKTHENFEKVKECIKNGEWKKIPDLLNLTKQLEQYLSDNKDVTIDNGIVKYKGEILNNCLTRRILTLMKEGFQFKHLLNFLSNLEKNSSHRAVNELYSFLEHQSLPITEDGCFLAYKAVRNDYKDIYSGTFDNRVGCKPEIQRNRVDEDKTRHCSSGLHVGALTYVKQYGAFGEIIQPNGNRLMIVKVNPQDAVSVPEDHNCTKLRVCKYEVVGEITDLKNILDKVVYSASCNSVSEVEPDFCEDDSWSCESEDFESDELTNSDDDYFLGRSHGIYDMESNRGYNPKYSESKKYMRGYKNGFNSNN